MKCYRMPQGGQREEHLTSPGHGGRGGGFPGENHLARDIKRNKKDMSRNIQGSTVDESQKLNTQMSINHRVNKRWHIQTMEHSTEKSMNCTNVEEIHKQHVEQKKARHKRCLLHGSTFIHFRNGH